MGDMMEGPYGKGCGKSSGSQMAIANTPQNTSLWIGGIAQPYPGVNEELQLFFNESIGGCMQVDMKGKGQLLAIFDTQENRNYALEQLNGAYFGEFSLKLWI